MPALTASSAGAFSISALATERLSGLVTLRPFWSSWVPDWFSRNLQQGNLLYVNTKKAEASGVTGWRDSLPSNVEAPVRGQKFPDFRKRILTEADIVNEEGGPVINWLEALAACLVMVPRLHRSSLRQRSMKAESSGHTRATRSERQAPTLAAPPRLAR